MQRSDPAAFSFTLAVRDIGRKGRTAKLEADADERTALAKVLGIEVIKRLAGEFSLEMISGGSVHLHGRLEADLVQTCVVSLEPVPQQVDELVAMTLLPAETIDGRPHVPTLIDPMDEDDRDTYSSGRIDLGMIVSEQLALHLDPYPRAPGAEFEVAGNAGAEQRDSPFAALERLKRDRG